MSECEEVRRPFLMYSARGSHRLLATCVLLIVCVQWVLLIMSEPEDDNDTPYVHFTSSTPSTECKPLDNFPRAHSLSSVSSTPNVTHNLNSLRLYPSKNQTPMALKLLQNHSPCPPSARTGTPHSSGTLQERLPHLLVLFLLPARSG